MLLAIFAARPEPLAPPEPEPMVVQLVPPAPPPPPPPVEAPPAPEKTSNPGGAPATSPEPVPDPPKPKPPPKRKPTPAPPPKEMKPIPASDAPTPAPRIELTDAQIAGAITAGSGSGDGTGAGGGSGAGGGACNMPRRVQNALRKDPRIRQAVAEAHSGRPLVVWQGDWVRHGTQEGAGLAAVREAIMWEVAFAPEACRREAVRGVVLISLNDGPGAARVAMGDASWRWSDMLGLQRSVRR